MYPQDNCYVDSRLRIVLSSMLEIMPQNRNAAPKYFDNIHNERRQGLRSYKDKIREIRAGKTTPSTTDPNISKYKE